MYISGFAVSPQLFYLFFPFGLRPQLLRDINIISEIIILKSCVRLLCEFFLHCYFKRRICYVYKKKTLHTQIYDKNTVSIKFLGVL